jgi:hypothetical protein
MKHISVVALVLLAACNAGATTPSEQPLPTVTSSTVATASASASAPAVAMSCTESFAAIDVSAISSTTDLMSLSDELDSTISNCGTMQEWSAAVQTVLPQVDLTQVEAFIRERCSANLALASTPLCAEVGS